MENNKRNMIKLLCLSEILKMETDEMHPLTTGEICTKMEKRGVSCDRRTVTDYVKALEQYGLEIMCKKVGHSNAYHVGDYHYSLAELKIMIDSIQAASFITEKKSKELIEKIAMLGGTHRSELLTDNMIRFKTAKHSNEHVYYAVSMLEEALREKKQASFLYFDLDENGNKVYRRDKTRYLTEPVALIYDNDNYYVVCYRAKSKDFTPYRLDRMDQVIKEDADISEDAIASKTLITGYTERVFSMFSGEEVNAVLQFDNSLIGNIYDKFGENTKMIRVDENTCVTTVKIQISPPFWGWIFQFSNRMQILSPKSLVDEYRKQCEKILTTFK